MSKEMWLVTIVSTLLALFSSIFLIHYEKFVEAQSPEVVQPTEQPASSAETVQPQPTISLWVNRNGQKRFSVSDHAQVFFRVDDLPSDTQVYVNLLNRFGKAPWEPLLENHVIRSGQVQTFPINPEHALVLQAGKQRLQLIATSAPVKWRQLIKKEPKTKGLFFWNRQKLLLTVTQ